MAVGSVFNLEFFIIYVIYGRKKITSLNKSQGQMLNSEPLFSSNYRLCVVAATNDLEVF